jgi:hypothetical protein
MPNFEHIKNDMPKFGHIKKYIMQSIKKHRNRAAIRKAVLFSPTRFYFLERAGNVLVNMSIGDPELWEVFWQSALTTGH